MVDFLAPGPYQTFTTRFGGPFTSDINGLIYGVSAGEAASQLMNEGCVPLAFVPGVNTRNMIDGGDFSVNPWQRNVAGLASGGVISSAISNTLTYFPDRFFAVGGSSSSILMANVADTTLPRFSNSLLVTRSSSNSNTAAINVGQVLETTKSIKAQNNYLTFSFRARTAANFSGGNLSVQLIGGTGTNQSAANMVAGSWTSQANIPLTANSSTGTSGSTALQPLTNSMSVYSFTTSSPVASTVTQLGVLLSWTPTGTAGTTDGIYFNGFQLEVGQSASNFEFLDSQIVLEKCQRYSWVVPEPAAGVIVGVGGATQAANNQVFYLAAPTQFLKAPTVTLSAGTFKVAAGAAAAAATGIAAGTTHTPSAISVTTTLTQTAGGAATLQGGGGSGYIIASADL